MTESQKQTQELMVCSEVFQAGNWRKIFLYLILACQAIIYIIFIKCTYKMPVQSYYGLFKLIEQLNMGHPVCTMKSYCDLFSEKARHQCRHF